MTYQVVKEEIVRRRPRWLTQIFLSHKPRLRLVAEEDSLEILSPKNYTYIRFSINQINDRDELNYSEV